MAFERILVGGPLLAAVVACGQTDGGGSEGTGGASASASGGESAGGGAGASGGSDSSGTGAAASMGGLGNTGGNSSSGGEPATGGAVSTGGNASTGGSGAGECGTVLPVTFRDFKGSGEPGGHPDFELSSLYPAGGSSWPSAKYGEPTPGSSAYKGLNEAGCGLIAATLDATIPEAPKPIFASGLGLKRGLTPERNPLNNPPVVQSVVSCDAWDWGWTPPNVIGSAESFSQWYKTVPGVNIEIPGELPLVGGTFDNPAFFPIDDQGWGNTPGQPHNYHFTTESHVTFEYKPGAGQLFSFSGDDDFWVFVNGILALDLGGVHEPMQGTIDFDAMAAALGIEAGGKFTMDIFHAERQTLESNFKVQTNISCFTPR